MRSYSAPARPAQPSAGGWHREEHRLSAWSRATGCARLISHPSGATSKYRCDEVVAPSPNDRQRREDYPVTTAGYGPSQHRHVERCRWQHGPLGRSLSASASVRLSSSGGSTVLARRLAAFVPRARAVLRSQRLDDRRVRPRRRSGERPRGRHARCHRCRSADPVKRWSAVLRSSAGTGGRRTTRSSRATSMVAPAATTAAGATSAARSRRKRPPTSCTGRRRLRAGARLTTWARVKEITVDDDGRAIGRAVFRSARQPAASSRHASSSCAATASERRACCWRRRRSGLPERARQFDRQRRQALHEPSEPLRRRHLRRAVRDRDVHR